MSDDFDPYGEDDLYPEDEEAYSDEIDRILDHFSLKDGDEVRLVKDDPDVKDMLMQFAEPLNGLFGSLATRYAVAVFAWNLGTVPDERREELMSSFIDPMVRDDEEGQATLRELIISLLDRREALYPDETSVILPTEDPDEDTDFDNDDDEDYTTDLGLDDYEEMALPDYGDDDETDEFDDSDIADFSEDELEGYLEESSLDGEDPEDEEF